MSSLFFQEQEFVRQQEVMSSLVYAVHVAKLSEQLRTYSLYKSNHFFGYGIAFHTESIQPTLDSHKLVYPLIEIEPNSPASDSGMKFGQRVVAVNGQFVNSDFRTLEDVVQAIEDSYYSRNFTDITVLDEKLWTQFTENPELAHSLANQHPQHPNKSKEIITEEPQMDKMDKTMQNEDGTLPRLCRLARSSRDDQYGYDFKTLKSEGRHVANNVRAGLPAQRAGLRDGDYILEVNGESIDRMEHDAVVARISQHPTQVDLMVVADLKGYLEKVKHQLPPPPLYKEPSGDEVELDARIPSPDVTYHRISLIPGFKGLGISLTPNGIINAIEPNSPSDKGNLLL